MRLMASSLLLTSSFISFTAFASCENPTMVAIPSGESVSMAELLTAQTSVKTYMAEMEEYLACINEEIDAAGDDEPAEFQSLMVTRHNTAVTEMETLAASFNEQVQAYRAANPE